MKLEHHYYFLQTKLTPCINNIAATYSKRNLKTALKHVSMVNVVLAEDKGVIEWVQNPDP